MVEVIGVSHKTVLGTSMCRGGRLPIYEQDTGGFRLKTPRKHSRTPAR